MINTNPETRRQDRMIVEQLRKHASDFPWQYFFTGTFKAEHNPAVSLSIAQDYLTNCQSIEAQHDRGTLSWMLFVEGERPKDRNFLCDERHNKPQGKRIRGTPRSHVHACVHFSQDPEIRINKKDAHYIWADWQFLHGRCLVQKIPQINDCIRYVTKYASKAIETDGWDVCYDTFKGE